MNYRENTKSTSDIGVDKLVFQQDFDDNENDHLVVGNDGNRQVGKITNSDKENKVRGLCIRNNLKNILREHRLARPRKNEWSEDKYTYFQRE